MEIEAHTETAMNNNKASRIKFYIIAWLLMKYVHSKPGVSHFLKVIPVQALTSGKSFEILGEIDKFTNKGVKKVCRSYSKSCIVELERSAWARALVAVDLMKFHCRL